MKQKILGASIGTCIHIAGLQNFLKIAEEEGYSTIFIGTSVSTTNLVNAIKQYRPQIVALSYRLTPEVAGNLFDDIKAKIKKEGIQGIKFIFGGTPPVCNIAKKSGIFEKVFNGTESINEVRNYLNGLSTKKEKEMFPQDLVERIKQKYPYPLLRHHFGLPSLTETIKGARIIAESGVLDILSIGPDQNAQEHFFHPKEMDHKQDGAGGVPLRKPEDLEAIYKATRSGNFPLVRCYAGTRDLIRWAEMCVKTINIAWGAIPLCWYSVLDGRSNRRLESAIRENQETIRWYAQRGISVEVNESHQWSLRYVSQYMFNTPPDTSPTMDLAKMLAKKKMIKDLEDEKFTVFTQVRAGLASLSPDPNIAKGQLCASAVLSLSLKPHILHVVGFSEGDHAVKPEELIESCKIVHGVLKNCINNFPNLTIDSNVQKRKSELIRESKYLLEAIKKLRTNRKEDPWTSPRVLSKAIKIGLLDAPHLKGNKYAKGLVETKVIDGACYTIDPKTGKILSEAERIKNLNLKKI